MCYECHAKGGVSVCVPCRRVWKGYSLCTCGEEGVYMGVKWRAPAKSDSLAWKRIAKGDYMWDKRAIVAKAEKTREKRLDFGRAAKLALRSARERRKAIEQERIAEYWRNHMLLED